MKKFPFFLLTVTMLTIAFNLLAREQSSTGDTPTEVTDITPQPVQTMAAEPANRPAPIEPAGRAAFRLPVGNLPISAYPDYDIYFDSLT